MKDLKYAKLVHRFEPEYFSTSFETGEFEMEKPGVYFRGACQIPGSEFNIGYGLCDRVGVVDPYPHKHWADEYLIFGAGTLRAKDWDAKLRFTIGLEDEAETFIIDEPMVIRIPAGVWHCPLEVLEVNAPFFFQPALQQGMFGGDYLMPEGIKTLNFNGIIDCVMDRSKKCDCCKKCLTLDWRN